MTENEPMQTDGVAATSEVIDKVQKEIDQKDIQEKFELDLNEAAETNFNLKNQASDLGEIYQKIYCEYQNRKNSLGGNLKVNNLIKRDFLETFYNQNKENNFKDMLTSTKEKLDKFFKLSEDKQIQSVNNFFDCIQSTLDYKKEKDKVFFRNAHISQGTERYFTKFKNGWINPRKTGDKIYL